MSARFITEPLYVGERFLLVVDFADEMLTGETISSCSATSAAYSGVSAGNIVPGSVNIVGTFCTVAVEGASGVLGVIYEVVLTALTSLNQSPQKSTYIAIVPRLP